MGFYDGFKDVIKIAQKADNIELYRKLLDLSAEALDLQEEIAKLKAENSELRKKKTNEDRIVRHSDPVITLKDENPALRYCSHCYDSEQLLIQLHCDEEEGRGFCPHCKTHVDFSSEQKTRSAEEMNYGISPFFSYDPYNH